MKKGGFICSLLLHFTVSLRGFVGKLLPVAQGLGHFLMGFEREMGIAEIR